MNLISFIVYIGFWVEVAPDAQHGRAQRVWEMMTRSQEHNQFHSRYSQMVTRGHCAVLIGIHYGDLLNLSL